MEKMLKKLRALNLAEPIYVLGMGISGRAALDLLREAGYEAFGVDEKVEERRIFKRDFDDENSLQGAGTLVISPGIDRRRSAISKNYAQQINDIEIFALLNDKPVLAVTGSNGKSTVVTMLQECLLSIGKKSRLCGNIGQSVLTEFFQDGEVDCYVLELSSYQLELCPHLRPQVAAILNVTPDHLDRYDSFEDYAAAKTNLAVQSSCVVLNGDDEYCVKMETAAQQFIRYKEDEAYLNHYGNGTIAINGVKIFDTKRLLIQGTHNFSNVLCTLLMLKKFGIDIQKVLPTLETFKGLPHRMQLVAEKDGIQFINDSKATNIGAVIAALSGLRAPILLIAGGVGKNQNFHELAAAMKKFNIKKTLLIGKDNCDLENALATKNLAFEVCGTMENAVKRAKELAVNGEIVLLSPATASFDQYSDYQERGNHFSYEVINSCA